MPLLIAINELLHECVVQSGQEKFIWHFRQANHFWFVAVNDGVLLLQLYSLYLFNFSRSLNFSPLKSSQVS